MDKVVLLLIVLSLSIDSLYSQNKAVKGRLITESFDTMIGVSITISDTVEVGLTDLDGFFEIEIPAAEKSLSFGAVGMDPTTIKLVDDCERIEVVVMLSSSYDFMSLKRVERKRKKRFKKLPEIHKQAFEDGLFKTKYACYNREFQ